MRTVHILITNGKKVPFRSLRLAKSIARQQLSAWLRADPSQVESGTWPRKSVGTNTVEVVTVKGAMAQRIWTAYERQEPCAHCFDKAWTYEVCGAGVQRRVCGSCAHPSYDCYCGRDGCDYA